MTYDDELGRAYDIVGRRTAERDAAIARAEVAERERDEALEAARAARDAEVEELRAALRRADSNLREEIAATGPMRATLEKVREHHRREEFEDSPGVFYCAQCQRTAGLWPCETVAILDESPTERETPADEAVQRVAAALATYDLYGRMDADADVWAEETAPEDQARYADHARALLALAERETPADEWEYAVRDYRAPGYILIGDDPLPTHDRHRLYGTRPLLRRRKAGPWEVVPDDRA